MINILIADDHKMFREGIKQIISKYDDLKVKAEAGCGSEVIEQLNLQKFDLVILDISMPGQTVFETIESIKRTEIDIPILILSMHPEEQYATRMLKIGVAGYLTKESAGEELIKAIRKISSGGKYVSNSLAETLAGMLDKNSDKSPHQLLSNREFEVLTLLAKGKTLKEIAEQLFLSEKTVTTYRARILEKLALKNNVELSHYALQNKLI